MVTLKDFTFDFILYFFVRILSVLESSIEDILHSKKKNSSFVSKRKHICRLEVVEKHSIYGMWMDPLLFIKVTLFDPRNVSKLAAILDVSLTFRILRKI